jgi:putative copper export protein
MGVGALAAAAGVILLMLLGGPPADAAVERLAVALSVAATVLLAAHALAWAAYARDPFGNEALLHPLTATAPGHLELVRIGFALMVVWALALARRPEFAIVLAACALIATGAAGHAAAIEPAWSIPAKILHVGALAVWAGGLAVLAATARRGADLQATALRASSLAFAAVAVLVATGVVQTLLVSPGLARLLRSAYGAVLIAKLIGMAVLVAMGARNRYRLVPRLPADDARSALRRSVRAELAVMLLVLLAAGLLAYVPVPREPYHATHVSLSPTER